ncbi:ABC transporter substrate-binding protein [Paenibacillus sepulcri]|uniref:ABC transporter substrate-binding protein n=1 Tax=Paenibacillus sepulcri TaxID=359917 RepID=A0ABS7BWJ2_9BACL|nr:ABC transporter substrate-binding protein [Paenibacillus sepulcri]
MKVRIRSWVLPLFAVLLAISVVACSSSSTPAGTSETDDASANEEPANSSADGKVVEVTYWHMWTSDWKKLIDSLVAEFNETHPNIKVNALSITGDANAKFLTAQAGGDPPDVMTQWNQIIPSWAEKGAILSLKDYIDGSAPDLGDWMYPIVREIGTYNGEMYAVPFSMNTFAMLYNKDVLEAEGFDPEKPPLTVQELDAMQDKLWKTDDRGFIQRVGFMPSWLTQWTAPFGGSWADAEGNPTATDPNNLAALEWFQSYAEKFDPTKVAAFNKSNTSNVNAAWPFLSGKQVFAVDGMWRLVDLQKYAPDLKYGVTPLPYPVENGKPNATWVNGNYNIIPAKAKHPKEAWEFILWLTGYHNEEWAASMLSKGGWIPASPKITEQQPYQDYLNEIPARRSFVDLLSSENAVITPLIPDQQYYWDRAVKAEEDVMTGKKDPKKALEDLQKEIENEISKNTK